MAQRPKPDFDKLRARDGSTPRRRRAGDDLFRGFNRFGSPTTCGILLANGLECREPAGPTSGAYHYHDRLRLEQHARAAGRDATVPPAEHHHLEPEIDGTS